MNDPLAWKIKYFYPEIAIFFTALIWLGLHWLFNFPAIYTYDGINYIYRILELGKTPGNLAWESSFYELYVYLMIWLSPLMVVATLFQILFFTSLATTLFSFIHRHLKMTRLSYLFITLFLLAPPNIFTTLMTERDNLFVIVGCFGLLALFKFLWDRDNQTLKKFIGLIFYFLVMTALRKEACFILVLLPLIALMFGREARLKKFLIHSGLVVLVFVFYVAFGSSVYGTKSTNQYFGNYNMTSVLRTVSYILVNQSEPLNQKDQKFVDSLVKVEELKKIPDIINMEYFTWYQPTSNEGMIQFYVFAARLIFNNLNLFFQFRTEIFKRNLDIPIVATPYLRDGPDYEFFPQFMQTQQKFFLRTKSLLTEENIFADYYRNSVQTGTLTFKFSSPIFSILILFTMMICFRMTPISSTVATVPILHSLLVYLFQPGLGTKHYFLAYISSFLIVVFFIFELRSYFRDDVKVLQQ